MTPAARVQAAVEILDEIVAGTAAERALTRWARRSRFAGSKDRAAIRDHVYDVLRRKQSCAALGGGTDGRALMLGLLKAQGVALDDVFGQGPYAPSALSESERTQLLADVKLDPLADLPGWIVEDLEKSLGGTLSEIATLMAQRADVILRVNLRKATVAQAAARLKEEGIHTQSHGASDTAFVVTEGARKIAQSKAYKDGLVELQDASSQVAIDLLPLSDDMRILDFCAGGGGKLLAMAGRSKARFFAHDAHEARLKDLPERARRAGVTAKPLSSRDLDNAAPFDLVFCDVPCSGSGSWRRDPEGKWRLSPEALRSIRATQYEILDRAAALVGPGGYLAYATCSMCFSENDQQVDAFLSRTEGWQERYRQRWTPLDQCDGFFTALMQRL